MCWWLSLALAVSSTDSALGRPGDLDPTFGAAGVARIPLGGLDSVGGLALQPDGKIVIAASTYHLSTLVRMNGHGALDSTFERDGIVTFIDDEHELAHGPVGVVVDSAAIHIGGAEFDLDRGPYPFLRTFDGSGSVVNRIAIPDNTIEPIALARGGGGRVLMLGRTPTNVLVAAFGNGALDSGFACHPIPIEPGCDPPGGILGFPCEYNVACGDSLDTSDAPSFAVDQESIVLLVLRTRDVAQDYDGWNLLRYDASGHLDTGFGTDGVVRHSGS